MSIFRADEEGRVRELLDVGVRYYGLPWGYELASLIGAVLEAGKTASSLTPESLDSRRARAARSRA
ncbi:MAG: hypothetical protein ACXWYO_04610 [Gaiellaceae bacterium]